MSIGDRIVTAVSVILTTAGLVLLFWALAGCGAASKSPSSLPPWVEAMTLSVGGSVCVDAKATLGADGLSGSLSAEVCGELDLLDSKLAEACAGWAP